jgi:hypothetical protein
MRTSPAIAALQRDRALHLQTRTAMVGVLEAWRAEPATATILAEMAGYGAGAPIARCPALFGLFTEPGSAPRLVAGLVRALCVALAGEPFGHPPLRHGFDRGSSTLLLARSGRALLVLHACEPGDRRLDVVTFADGERREAVLAGEARGRIVCRRGRSGVFAERRIALSRGARVALDLREEALQVTAIDRRLVSLRLHRSARNPGPTREYDLSSGALLRQAAGDIRISRQEMMLALLGRMGRVEAAPLMAEIARGSGDASLRWQALRECLALDTAEGFAALAALAGAARDPLVGPAGSLRAQLLEAHPQLAALGIA